MTAILAIDSGNTRIKWGFHDNGVWKFTGHVLQGDGDSLTKALSALPETDLVVISNVAGNEAVQMLLSFFLTWHIQPYWIHAPSFQCGVYNHYKNPDQLGSDRWAALVAAWHAFSKACVVVNVGTTMTVDVLSNEGVFRGGLILPGPDLMITALRAGTALPGSLAGSFVDFPLCTVDAIKTGVVSGLVGAIERSYHLFSSESNNVAPICIITGGALSIIQSHLSVPIIVSEYLVLDGLVALASDRHGVSY